MQLRFASFAVANSREDFHLQDRAHAGRTTKNKRPEISGRLFFGVERRLINSSHRRKPVSSSLIFLDSGFRRNDEF